MTAWEVNVTFKARFQGCLLPGSLETRAEDWQLELRCDQTADAGSYELTIQARQSGVGAPPEFDSLRSTAHAVVDRVSPVWVLNAQRSGVPMLVGSAVYLGGSMLVDGKQIVFPKSIQPLLSVFNPSWVGEMTSAQEEKLFSEASTAVVGDSLELIVCYRNALTSPIPVQQFDQLYVILYGLFDENQAKLDSALWEMADEQVERWPNPRYLAGKSKQEHETPFTALRNYGVHNRDEGDLKYRDPLVVHAEKALHVSDLSRITAKILTRRFENT